MTKMNETLVALAGLVPTSASVISAGYLAAHGMDGWGWFLVGGFFLFPKIRTGKAAEIAAQQALEESRRDA